MNAEPVLAAPLPARFSDVSAHGQGAYGKVYRAFDEVRQEVVAVKTLHHLAPDSLVRFKREFRHLQDLYHPNLVRVHELLEDEGWHLVMEYVDGSSLADEPIGEHLVAAVFPQIVDGLQALHAAGHVHRDLKPANVLLDKAGNVRLVDFGFVAASGAEPGASWIGSPAYASPEQLSGGRAGPASDAYALGVMLYEVFEGKTPFQGSAMKMARAKRTSTAPALTYSNPLMRALVCDLLECDTAKRPSMSDVRAALHTANNDFTPLHRPPASVEGRVTGRDALFRRLHASMEDLRSGGGLRVVYLEGDSGIGKTTVLDAFADELRGATLVQGRCFEAETVPFKALDSAVDDLVTQLRKRDASDRLAEHAKRVAPLFPVAAALCGAEAQSVRTDPWRRRVEAVDSLVHLFAACAGDEPLALLLDDVQWADDDGMALLQSLCRHERFPRALLVLAFRPGKPLPFSLPGQRETLTRLTPADSRRLSEQLLGSDTDAQRVAHLSGGDPFLLTELCRADALPATLDAFVETRLADLSDAERTLLTVIDLAGVPVPLSVFHEGGWVSRTTHTIESLVQKGHLVRASKHAAFLARHARILSGVRTLTTEVERIVRQKELAAAWIQASPHTLPEHLATTEPLLVRLAERAAHALAFDSAAEFYRRALSVATPVSRSALSVGLGECLSASGRELEAATVYREAAACADAEMAPEFRRRVAERLLRAGLVSEGMVALDESLAEVGIRRPIGPRATVASLLWHRAQAALYENGLPTTSRESAAHLGRCADLLLSAGIGLNAISGLRGSELAARSYVYALRSQDEPRILRSRLIDAMYGAGASDRGAARAKRLFLKVEQGPVSSDVRTLLNVGRSVVAFHRMDFNACYERALAAEAQRDVEGLPLLHREVTTISFHSTMSLALAGRYREAQTRVDLLSRRADATSDHFISRHMRSGFISHATLATVGEDEAHRRLHEYRTEAHDEFTLLEYCGVIGLAALDLYRGDPFRAFRRAERMWPRLKRSLISRSRLVRLSATDLRARCALMVSLAGGPSRTRLIRESINALEKDTLPCSRAWAAALRAASAEQSQQAQAYYRHAAAIFDEVGMKGHAAASRFAFSGDESGLSALGVRKPARFARVLVPLCG